MKKDKNEKIAEEKSFLHNNLNFEGLEAYKQIRANISFLVPNDADRKCKIIGITSSIRGEGKSTTSINIAYVLAEAGNRVLLIDGDMRIPSIGKKIGISISPGLSNILSSSDDGAGSILKDHICKKWDILPSGDIPPNPSELLSSVRFNKFIDEVAKEYDYCILDLPPVNIVSDAIEASAVMDGMIIVVREGYTEQNDLAECMRKLSTVNTRVFGLVANDVRISTSKYKYRGKSRSYKYKYKYSRDSYER